MENTEQTDEEKRTLEENVNIFTREGTLKAIDQWGIRFREKLVKIL